MILGVFSLAFRLHFLPTLLKLRSQRCSKITGTFLVNFLSLGKKRLHLFLTHHIEATSLLRFGTYGMLDYVKNTMIYHAL